MIKENKPDITPNHGYLKFFREGQGNVIPLINFNTQNHNLYEIPDLFIYVFVISSIISTFFFPQQKENRY